MTKRLNKIIRSVNSALSFIAFGTGALILAGIILPGLMLLTFQKDRRRLLFCRSIRWSWILFVKIMECLKLIKINITPTDKQILNNLQSTIVVTNHPSLIDIVILVSLVNKPICIAKGKLTRNFFMRHIILHTYIHNEQSPDKLLSESKMVLDQGYNLIIFPEGTRTLPAKSLKLQRGAAHIALNSGHNILTARINNSDNILGKNQKWYDVGFTTVIYDIKIKENINSQVFRNSSDQPSIAARKLTALIKNNIEK